MLFLKEDEVRKLLPMSEAISLVRSAFMELARNRAINQPRRRLILPSHSILHSMAGAYGQYYGTKVYSTNAKYGAYFFFLLFRAEDALPLAIMEANFLGQLRTGAASAVATQVMARKDAEVLGMIGSGFQARMQAVGIAAAVPLRRILVYSRDAAKRERFAEEVARETGLEVRAAGSAEEVVRGADILVTATNSRKPVLEADWVQPGTHINAIGSNSANRQELPAELILRCNLIAVDSLEQARIECGDLLQALEPAEWQQSHIVELKDLLGVPPAANNGQAITLFESNGIAVEDVAVGAYVYERAEMEQVGSRIAFFGMD